MTHVRHVVVVGHGMAGGRLVEELAGLRPGPSVRITVYGQEEHVPYNRVLLTNVLAGGTAVEDVLMSPPDWYAERGIRIHRGVTVTGIDPVNKTVTADDGTVQHYDDLVLATGSRPIVPPIEGLTRVDGALRNGAFVFRTLDDCQQLRRSTTADTSAVVIGGGLLGLEAARGLAGRGVAVTIVHLADRLMERQLDAAAGRLLLRAVRDLGIGVRLGVQVQRVEGDEAIEGVQLDDGSRVPANLLLVACGVRADVALARAGGIRVERGVVVDDQLRSVSDPHVYALGECAQHAGEVYGLVAPAWEQARVLARVLTGSGRDVRYTGSRVVVRLKAAGMEVATMGNPQVPDDENVDVVCYLDSPRGTYKKLVIRDGRISGAIMIGELGTVGTVTQHFDRDTVLPDDRMPLLFTAVHAGATDAVTHQPGDAVVCHCNGVTTDEIRRCWSTGNRTVSEIQAGTRAMSGCGTCRTSVSEILATLSEANQ